MEKLFSSSLTSTPRHEYALMMGEAKDGSNIPLPSDLTPRKSLAEEWPALWALWGLSESDWHKQSPAVIQRMILEANGGVEKGGVRPSVEEVGRMRLTRPELMALRLYTGKQKRRTIEKGESRRNERIRQGGKGELGKEEEDDDDE